MTKTTNILGLAAALGALAITGCGGGSSPSGTGGGGTGGAATGGSGGGTNKPASDRNLNLGYYEDIQSPDPDIQYDIPGLEIVNNVYEGLVKYGTGTSTKIEPWLATSWTISKDKKVYTFKLRPGVVFHDGTTFDAAAAKASFERRIALKQGTYYQVQAIKSIATPDASTLKITLKAPTSAFMDYLASPYSVKMISPTAIKAHTKGNDHGQAWLGKHDAGTGAYTLTQFTLGQQYAAKAWDKWWGPAPYYKTILFKLVPDSGSQVLQLKGGDLDILHQQPITTVDQFKSMSGFQTKVFPVFLKTWIHVNPNRPPFNVPAVRQVLGQAINRDTITKTFFGAYGTTSNQMYPKYMLAPNLAPDAQPFDSSKLKAAVAKLPSSQRKVDLIYLSGHGADIQRVSEEVGNELRQTGLQVNVHEVPVATLFAYPSKDPKSAPNLFIGSENPDSANPDTWGRPYMYKGGGLNYLGGSVPAADAKMDAGLAATDPTTATDDYVQAGAILHDAGNFITIADPMDTFIARTGITGFTHQLSCVTCLVLSDLKAG
ncbi:MAG: peptide/nickel transport system substrate-binding protein [Baekduia sp.]|jgi:peptide/nickel transport system substrate-binding protein|nr:peptide/nickel transport system substrate-binding protein [Baekduia sp.]